MNSISQNKQFAPWLPDRLRRGLKRIKFQFRRWVGRRRLARDVVASAPQELKLVVGGGGVIPAGWIETDIEYLNLLDRADWTRYFTPGMVDAILAEHVWEHLTEEQGLVAALMCREFLRPGGHLRLAVPDGGHPDPDYRECTRVGGTGEGADDHKIFYTHLSLDRMLREAGFETRWLEYFDNDGEFRATKWTQEDGMIYRSAAFDERNQVRPLSYTSLIVDAVKPLDSTSRSQV